MFAGFMDGLSYTPLTCCEVIEVLAGPLGASLGSPRGRLGVVLEVGQAGKNGSTLD